MMDTYSPKTTEYLKQLEQRNRTKKLDAPRHGFDLHWAGANEERLKHRQRPSQGTRTESKPRRKTWSTPGRARAASKPEEDNDTIEDESQVPEEVLHDDDLEDEVEERMTAQESAQFMMTSSIPRTKRVVLQGAVRMESSEQQGVSVEDVLAAGQQWKEDQTTNRAARGHLSDTKVQAFVSKLIKLNYSQQKLLYHLVSQLHDETSQTDDDPKKNKSDATALRQCLDILKRLGQKARSKQPSSEYNHTETAKHPLARGTVIQADDTHACTELNPKGNSTLIRLRIRDGWGGPRLAGLDALALVSGNEIIQLTSENIHLFAGSPLRPAPATSRSATELPRLLLPPSERKKDREESWIVRLPSDGPVEIVIQVPDGLLLENEPILRVWNCTADPTNFDGIPAEPGSLGAKSVQILLNECLLWSGELKPSARTSGSALIPIDIPLTANSDAKPKPFSQEKVNEEQGPAVVQLVKNKAEPVADTTPIQEEDDDAAREDEEDSIVEGQETEDVKEKLETNVDTTHTSTNEPGPVHPPQVPIESSEQKPEIPLSEKPVWLTTACSSPSRRHVSPVKASPLDDSEAYSAADLDKALKLNPPKPPRETSLLTETDNGNRSLSASSSARRRRRRSNNDALSVQQPANPIACDKDSGPTAQSHSEEVTSAQKIDFNDVPINPNSKVVSAYENNKLSPLSQLAGTTTGTSLNGFENRHDLIAQPEDEEDDILQQSWESLSYFSRKNRSRLGQAGASVLSSVPQEPSPGRSNISLHENKTLRCSVDSSGFATVRTLTRTSSGNDLLIPSSPKQQSIRSPKMPMVEIPTLPRGRKLRFELLSTWGDPHYVGLHGIEIFDEHGLPLMPVSINASPPSINVLPEYDNDPRTADKLIDGVPYTCDEMHSWLAPYDQGHDHSINLDLIGFDANNIPALSMIRVWNYNKSRAHSYRGVRRLRALLDNTPIFYGEIRKASGVLEGADCASETILFTMDDALLEKIEQNDTVVNHFEMNKDSKIDHESISLVREAQQLLRTRRPPTAEAEQGIDGSHGLQRIAVDSASKHLTYHEMLAEEGLSRHTERPRTSIKYISSGATLALANEKALAGIDEYKQRPALSTIETQSENDLSSSVANNISSVAPRVADKTIKVRQITLRLLATWGDAHYVGLSGIHLYSDKMMKEIKIQPSQLEAKPRDLQSLGYAGDPRTLEKLVDGVSQTSDDKHFWLIPFSTTTPPWITIDLGKKQSIWGLGIYNYNKSPEDTLRGVRSISIELDGVAWGVVAMRPAPGRGIKTLDFKQVINLHDPPCSNGECKRNITTKNTSIPSSYLLNDYETPTLPCGSLMRFVFHGTHGDSYYVGLDGIEFRDSNNQVIPVNESQVYAVPDSVRVLGGEYAQDIRLPRNLFCIHHESSTHSWLAPNRISMADSDFPNYPDENELYVFFHQPVCLSSINIWNYTKTPARGVREMSLWIDGCIVARVRVQPSRPGVNAQQISFTSDRTRRQRSTVTEPQDVLCIDENQVRIRSKTMFNTEVSADGAYSCKLTKERPTTSMMAC